MISFWEDFDAIRRFAGPHPEKAVYYPEDDRFLLGKEPNVAHYEVAAQIPAAPATSRAARREPRPDEPPVAAGAIALLLSIFDEAFERKAWQGPNLRGSLRGVTAREAAWRPAPGRHNIWELALHAAYWKYAVRRMLTGEKRGSFPREGSNWFARPASASEATEQAWRADVALLSAEHRRLRETVASLPAAALSRRPPRQQVPDVEHDLRHRLARRVPHGPDPDSEGSSEEETWTLNRPSPAVSTRWRPANGSGTPS